MNGDPCRHRHMQGDKMEKYSRRFVGTTRQEWPQTLLDTVVQAIHRLAFSSDEHGKGKIFLMLLFVLVVCQPWLAYKGICIFWRSNAVLLSCTRPTLHSDLNIARSPLFYFLFLEWRIEFGTVCNGTQTAKKRTMMMKIVLNGTFQTPTQSIKAWASSFNCESFKLQQPRNSHCSSVEDSGGVDDDKAHKHLQFYIHSHIHSMHPKPFPALSA